MTRITLCDSTLRDGSHPMAHQYTVEQVTAVAGALERVGVGLVRCDSGDLDATTTETVEDRLQVRAVTGREDGDAEGRVPLRA